MVMCEDEGEAVHASVEDADIELTQLSLTKNNGSHWFLDKFEHEVVSGILQRNKRCQHSVVELPPVFSVVLLHFRFVRAWIMFDADVGTAQKRRGQ